MRGAWRASTRLGSHFYEAAKKLQSSDQVRAGWRVERFGSYWKPGACLNSGCIVLFRHQAPPHFHNSRRRFFQNLIGYLFSI